MKTILRNFLSVIRRFKMAMLLNIVGLAIAFAAFMVIMMQLDYDWSFSKSHLDSDRIYRIEVSNYAGNVPILPRPFADQFIASSPHIVAGALTAPSFNTDLFFTIEKDGEKSNYREPVLKVSPNYGGVFEFDMVEGESTALNNPDVVLIPLSLSKKLFGNESAIGKQLKSNLGLFTVGGVYSDFPENTIITNNIYYPMSADEHLNDWHNSMFYCFIRLDSPANKEIVLDNFVSNNDPVELGNKTKWLENADIRLTSIPDIHFTTDTVFDFTPKAGRQTLLVLLAIAFIIILIAGINFTNFSTALAPMRIKSINTQKVLGAEQTTIRSALIAEAILVSSIAYLLSLGLISWFARTDFSAIVSADLSMSAHPYILLFTAGIALISGLLAGIYPSFYVTSFSPALVLKGSFGLSSKGRALRNTLISVQFLASFALIICSIFMYLQNRYMQESSFGYDKDNLIVSDLPVSMWDKKEAYSNQLRNFSGVDQVTFSDIVLSGADQYMDWGINYNDKFIQFQCLPVDPSFLDVMGIDVIDGRNFRQDDQRLNVGGLIFNEKAQKAFDLVVGEKVSGMEIVGIIPDIKFASFRTEVVPMAFHVWGMNKFQNPMSNYAYIKLKEGADVKETMAHIQQVSQAMDPDYTFNIKLYDEVIHGLYKDENQLSSMIILFSIIAVLISMVGVFGLVVFESEYKRKEIGIRKVLGSTTRQILAMFNKHYFQILFICFVIAAPIAYYTISRWLENFAYKSPMHWWVFLLSFLIVNLVTSLTVTFQSWRVANANPVDSIKTE